MRALVEAKPLDAEMIADWLVCEGKDLYGSGSPCWHYAETVNEPWTHPTAIPAVPSSLPASRSPGVELLKPAVLLLLLVV